MAYEQVNNRSSRCPVCNSAVAEEEIYCHECGVRLDGFKLENTQKVRWADAIPVEQDQYAPGRTIFWGHYPQGINGEVAPIEWRIMKSEGHKLLLLSLRGLDCLHYHSSHHSLTWETCSLRHWLNNDFYDQAFSPAEKQAIDTTMTSEDTKRGVVQWWFTAPARDTLDDVFLLSLEDAKVLFASEEDRRCAATPFAIRRGVYTNGRGHAWWWLRSPGDCAGRAAGVDYTGSIAYSGMNYDKSDCCVRPAIQLDADRMEK